MPVVRVICLAMEVWGGIFALMIALCILFIGTFQSESEHWMVLVLIATAILLFFDIPSWIYDGVSGTVAYDVLVISNFVTYIAGYVILALFTRYVNCFVETERFTREIYIVAAAGILLTVINQFTHIMYEIDSMNIYRRGRWFILSQITGIVGAGLLAAFLIRKRRELGFRQFVSMFIYIALPFLAMVVQIFYYGMPLLNIAIAISIIINFAMMLMNQSRILAEQKKEIVNRDRKLARERERVNDMKIRLVLSQIKPHFLFNALNSIYYLIEQSPEQARAAIDSFSDYLRGNMAALESVSLVPFLQEMRHVKSYLRLEEMRFQDELEVIYDLDTLDFNIPSLSVEPMVENAVKHGVAKKADGGYVRIKTAEVIGGYKIWIEDNGVGFDMDDVANDGKLHVGIANVRTRIESMAKGTLEIESEIGKGTCVTIFIPRETGSPKVEYFSGDEE